jgi:hypothetical protein
MRDMEKTRNPAVPGPEHLVHGQSGFHPITDNSVGQTGRVSKFSAKTMRTIREHGAKLVLMDRSYSATRGLKLTVLAAPIALP